MSLTRAVGAIAVPAAALLAAWLAVPRLAEVPPSLSGVKLYAPHIAIAAALAIAIGFGRSRAVFALAVLALGYAALRVVPGDVHAHAILIAVPLNLGALAWRREAPIASAYVLRYAAALAAQVALIAAAGRLLPDGLQAALSQPLFASWGKPAWTQPAMLACACGVALAAAAWIRRREATALALAATAVTYAVAARTAPTEAAPLFIATAALVLGIAVLQDVFRMAFRDPLTDLMSRRALDEHLAALGRRYAIAVVDVDHFKRVNDTYGHETGDQVLKMVAGQLARSGGRAYRHGGEEFTLVFPGHDTDAVWETLEALRKAIAAYPFRLRSGDRAQTGRRGRNRPGGGARLLKVTVSIGVAHAQPGVGPQAVLACADKALYRAKHNGRNAVARHDRRR